MSIVHLQDNGLYQLHIVLNGLRIAFVEREMLKKIDMKTWLRKDVDQTVYLVRIGENKIEKFQNNKRGKLDSLSPEKFGDNLVLAKAPFYVNCT